MATSLRALSVCALSLCAPACDSGASESPEPVTAPEVTPQAEPAPEDEVKGGPYRVLVTGFNDWKDLGEPPNVWRCRDNPSCRLLLGAETTEAPAKVHGGALLDLLTATTATEGGRPIEWTFKTMPVTWGAAAEVPVREYNLVVHLGLGVYDNFDHILVESGAYNRRKGKDAKGSELNESIDASAPERREAPAQIKAKLAGLDAQVFAGYTLNVAEARPSNDYLCNETHYRALQELGEAQADGAPLERVHFVHIPYAKDGDYAALAQGVGGVVLALLE